MSILETNSSAVKGDAASAAMEVDPATPVGSAVGKKRKRQVAKPMFRNWQPPEWGKVETVPTREIQADFSVEEDTEGWVKREGLGGQVKRTMRVNEVSKIRKLGNGTIGSYALLNTLYQGTLSERYCDLCAGGSSRLVVLD